MIVSNQFTLTECPQPWLSRTKCRIENGGALGGAPLSRKMRVFFTCFGGGWNLPPNPWKWLRDVFTSSHRFRVHPLEALQLTSLKIQRHCKEDLYSSNSSWQIFLASPRGIEQLKGFKRIQKVRCPRGLQGKNSATHCQCEANRINKHWTYHLLQQYTFKTYVDIYVVQNFGTCNKTYQQKHHLKHLSAAFHHKVATSKGSLKA